MSRRLEAPDETAKALSKRLASHNFDSEQGDEYEASTFGGFKDYFARKRTKLQNRDAHLRSTSAPAPAIFAGLVITVNGYTIPSLHTLNKLIVTHGGSFLQYMDGKTRVTHIIASNLTPKKKVEFARYKVVKPEWITESIAQGVLLPWSEYRLIDSTPAQRKLGFATPGSTSGEVVLKKSEVGSSSSRNIVGPSVKKVVDVIRSSGMRKVVDRPPSTLSKDITIPPSDELDFDEDEFPSYQTPANDRTSFTAVPSAQPQKSFNDEGVDNLLSSPSRQQDGQHTTQEKIIADSDGEPEVFISPINLVSFLPTHSNPKDKPLPNTAPPQLPHSSPPPESTFNQKPPPQKSTQAPIPPLPKPRPTNDDEEVLYEPECIIGQRKHYNKRKPKYRRNWTQYLIHWAGFAYHEATWEFEKDLKGDLGAEGLEEMVGEWRAKERRNVGSAEVYKEVPKEELVKGAFFMMREVEEAFLDDVGSSPGEVIVVKQVSIGIATEVKSPIVDQNRTSEKSPAVSIYRTDNFTPQNHVQKEVPGTMDSEETILSDKITGEVAGNPEEISSKHGTIRSEEHITPAKITPEVATNHPQPVSMIAEQKPTEDTEMGNVPISGQSFGSIYGTPVDFPEQYVNNTISVEPDATKSLKPTTDLEDFLGQYEEEIFGGDLVLTQSQKSVIKDANTTELLEEETFGTAPNIIEPLKSTAESNNSVDYLKEYGEEIFGESINLTQSSESTRGNVPTVVALPMDVPALDRMEIGNQETDPLVNFNIPDDDSMSTMDLLTPRDALEEYEDLDISEELPGASKSPKKPLERKLFLKDQSEMTAEEHNASYLADPAIRAQTVLNPNFLKNYFQESRLHHLSTWKAKIRAELQASIQQLNPKKNRPRRYIIHVDFDCFFASVSTRDRPDLVGKPVAIAHGGNSDNSKSSEIAACNYAARGFGVKNGMWMAEAKQLCPDLICLGYDYPKYEEASKVFYGVIAAVGAERIQAVSVDEALLDISNICCDTGLETEQQEERMAESIATLIRGRCREQTGGLEVSVGIGGNVLLAKLAMRKAKPAGQYLLSRSQVAEFMNDVAVRELPGIGSNIASKVEESFRTNKIGEIKAISQERLKHVLGEKTGEKLYGYCRGLDQTVVGEKSVRKSISADINWGVRFESQEQAELFVMQIAEEVENRMKAEGVRGKHLTLKVNKRAAHAPFMTRKFLGHGECDTTTKSILLGVPTSNKDILGKEAVTMLRLCRISPGELRGLGLTVTRLEEAQAGKIDSNQKKLNFSKGLVKDVPERNKPEEVVVARENIPPDRPLPKAYVPPKVTTLMDKWNLQKVPKEKKPLTKVQQEPGLGCTQFDIPDELDPEVLQFYPTPIREQALRKIKERELQGQGKIQDELPLQDSSSQSPPPPNSQIDLTVWRELPREFRVQMRAEAEAEAERLRRQKSREKAPTSPSKKQSILPPSPHKTSRKTPKKEKVLPWGRSGTATPPRGYQKHNSLFSQDPGTPTRKRRGRPPALEAGPSRVIKNPNQILDMKGNDVSGWLFDEGEIDPGFFSEINEEFRQEIVAEAVRKREIRLEEIRQQERKEAAERERLANAVRLPVPDRQTMLSAGRPVQTIKQIKDALEGWHEACAEGPHESDTEEFVQFLKRLVLVENSMPKADEAVRFFMNLVGREEPDWWDVVEKLARGVNDALDEIGLGPIDFGLEYDFYDFQGLVDM